MAQQKRNRKSQKRTGPFDSLIDLAGGAAMNAIADSMEKKHNYRQRGVPNPYRASAFGIASGRMKTTKDVARLGSMMGAMGAFDDDTATPASKPAKSHISAGGTKISCAGGSENSKELEDGQKETEVGKAGETDHLQLEADSREEEEKNRQQRLFYRKMKRCQYCGGAFTGIFKKKCRICGKPKDYA